jgi:hypothetical protein
MHTFRIAAGAAGSAAPPPGNTYEVGYWSHDFRALPYEASDWKPDFKLLLTYSNLDDAVAAVSILNGGDGKSRLPPPIGA